MNLQEWRERRSQGEEATLPSGLAVRLRKVNVMDLAEQGKIPQTLQAQVDEVLAGGMGQMSLEKVRKYGDVVNVVCRAAIVAPEGLEVEELPFEDRLAVFTWANQVAGKLQSFRGEPNGAVGAAQPGPGLRETPQ